MHQAMINKHTNFQVISVYSFQENGHRHLKPFFLRIVHPLDTIFGEQKHQGNSNNHIKVHVKQICSLREND